MGIFPIISEFFLSPVIFSSLQQKLKVNQIPLKRDVELSNVMNAYLIVEASRRSMTSALLASEGNQMPNVSLIS